MIFIDGGDCPAGLFMAPFGQCRRFGAFMLDWPAAVAPPAFAEGLDRLLAPAMPDDDGFYGEPPAADANVVVGNIPPAERVAGGPWLVKV